MFFSFLQNLVEEAEKANVNISFDEESESEDMKDVSEIEICLPIDDIQAGLFW